MSTAFKFTSALIFAVLPCIGSNRNALGQEVTNQSFLKLSFEQFDQDMNGGWRISAQEGKYPEAAKMIEAYLSKGPNLKSKDRRMLHFHAGQMLAMGDKPKEAIEHFKKSTQPNENDFMRWNAYVEGTIAFLEKDKARLEAAREEVSKAQVPLSFNKNLVVLDLLIKSSDSSYKKIFEGLIAKNKKRAQKTSG